MTALEKRYQVAIDKIGHARLLNLPEQMLEIKMWDLWNCIYNYPPQRMHAGSLPAAILTQKGFYFKEDL